MAGMFLTYLTKSLFWDSLIVLFILFGCALVVYGFRKKHRSQWVRIPLIVFGFIFTITIIYGSFIEPRMITITEAQITLPTVSDFTIVTISDLHVGPYKGKKYLGKVVEKINALEPDIVLLAGDYVYSGGDPVDDLTPLRNLRARYGVFGVLGNHEYGCMSGGGGKSHVYGTFDASRKVLRALERSGVKMLNNESVEMDLEEGGLPPEAPRSRLLQVIRMAGRSACHSSVLFLRSRPSCRAPMIRVSFRSIKTPCSQSRAGWGSRVPVRGFLRHRRYSFFE